MSRPARVVGGAASPAIEPKGSPCDRNCFSPTPDNLNANSACRKKTLKGPILPICSTKNDNYGDGLEVRGNLVEGGTLVLFFSVQIERNPTPEASTPIHLGFHLGTRKVPCKGCLGTAFCTFAVHQSSICFHGHQNS